MINMIIWGFLIKTIIYISVFGIISQIIDNIIERRKQNEKRKKTEEVS